jgi:hypothetical protein
LFSAILPIPRPPIHESFAGEEEAKRSSCSSTLENPQAMLSTMFQRLFHLLCHSYNFSVSLCRSVSCFKDYRFLSTVFLKMNETIPLLSFYFKLIRFLGLYSQSVVKITTNVSAFNNVSDVKIFEYFIVSDVKISDEDFFISDRYFTAVTCFLTFNVFSVIGNCLTSLCRRVIEIVLVIM